MFRQWGFARPLQKADARAAQGGIQVVPAADGTVPAITTREQDGDDGVFSNATRSRTRKTPESAFHRNVFDFSSLVKADADHVVCDAIGQGKIKYFDPIISLSAPV